jgi:hypothetical protein
MLKCPRKNKNCKPSLIFGCKGDNFICSGINKKPSKYKKDYVMLCLKGQISDRSMEMTVEEACFITSAIMATTGTLAPAIIKEPKCSK